ncbi:hypothetical protein DLAC_07840 [Tieghemostelium lacteum]|uniref:Uncharacterized protein n=1 Tax=Tieghemostelium lacteum TaxID=361077 RepID=A0A151ZAK3_TIELA|nr:hypothetical protein DLAC_07840 [Tieghemostelium lacteum]|eukprot:KYQ90958.1 hypothetical protein DLAC_07840 [Tieghemostelium lacteum]
MSESNKGNRKNKKNSDVVPKTPIETKSIKESISHRNSLKRNNNNNKLSVKVDLSFIDPAHVEFPLNGMKCILKLHYSGGSDSSFPISLNENGKYVGIITPDIKGRNRIINVILEAYTVCDDIYMVSSYSEEHTMKSNPEKDEDIIVYKVGCKMERNSIECIHNFYRLFTTTKDMLGKEVEDKDNGYIGAFAMLIKAASFARLQLGVAVGKLKVAIYDEDEIYTSTVEEVTGEDGTKTFEYMKEPVMVLGGDTHWEPFALYHEYGHYIQHLLLRRIDIKNVAPEGSHFPCDATPQNPTLAFYEGYANAFSRILLKEFGHQYIDPYVEITWKSGSYKSLENGFSIEYFFCDKDKMLTDEGRIAAMIYDLYDSEDDSQQHKEIPNIIEFVGMDEKYHGIDKSWFGTLQKDNNQGLEIPFRQLLVDFTSDRGEDYNSVKGYINAMRKKISGDQLEKALDIIRYNYGSDLLQ